MALEQILDSGGVDGKADVFSLGVILYEILAGRMPHKPGQAEVMLGKRMLEAITPIRQLLPSLAAPLGDLAMAMLSVEAPGRPTMAEVDRELRRARGLPPARPSGFHQPMAARVDPPLITTEVPGGTVSLVPLPTPSGEQALGELSPPQVPLPPPSLSSLPSVEAPAPPLLRAGPADRTSARAPTPLPVAVLASPSAPTASGAPSRRAYYLLGAALVLSAGISLLIAQRPHHSSQRAPVPADRPSATVGTAARSAEASSGDRAAPIATPQAAPVVPTANPTPAPGANEAVPDKPDKKPSQVATGSASHRPGDLKSTATSSGRPRCPAVTFTDDCVKGKNLSPDVRRNVLLALRDQPMRMCAGDRLIIGMGTDGVRLLETPARLSDTAKQDFLLTLRGYLDVTPAAGKIEIQCPERQP